VWLGYASATRTLTRFELLGRSRLPLAGLSAPTPEIARDQFPKTQSDGMKGQGQKLAACFMASDLIIAAASWVVAYWLRFHTPVGPIPEHGIPPLDWCLRGLPLILLLMTVSCRVGGLYHLDRLRSLGQELPGILRSNGVLVLLLISVMFYFKDPYRSRLVVAIFTTLNVVGLVISRRAAWSVIHSLRGRGFNPSPALIVGSGRTAQKLAQELRRNSWTGLSAIGFVDDAPGRTVQDLPVLGTIQELSTIIQSRHVAYVFVALPVARYDLVEIVMRQLADVPVDVRLVPDVPNLAAMSLTTAELGGLPILGLRRNPHDGLQRFVKRAMDVVVATAAIVFLSPLFALIAALVKLTGGRGPVFYRQERAGLGGQPFEMLKFRTMRVDAELHTGPVWAAQNDSRRTWLGCLLRRSSLDELPQLFNVLRGEMSIVGPRPERPVFVERFRHTVPHYMLRHTVKAGITGWAQVHGWRGNTSLRKRVQYDLHYITHWTPWLDLRIMFLTIFRGMVGQNAY
jgi:Undecaprenyl-phosphate glucose phosphotransferase